MNGLILAIALLGQPQWGSAASGQFDRQEPRARSRVVGPRAHPKGVQIIPVTPDEPERRKSAPVSGLAQYSVRIGVPQEDDRSWHLGSGVVVAVSGGKAYALTNNHVVRGADEDTKIQVRYGDERFPGKLLGMGDGGDIAIIEFEAPPNVKVAPIGAESAQQGTYIGWGGGEGRLPSSQLLHTHVGRLVSPAQMVGEQAPDVRYAFYPEEGDSGGGVFNEAGELTGLVHSKDPLNHSAIVVSCGKIHRMLGAAIAERGGKRIVTISPFFLKFRTEVDPPQPEVIVQNPPPAGIATPGPQGPQGPPGKDGVAGKDAPAVDLSAIEARLAALEAGGKANTALIDKISQAVVRPITFAVVKSDGTTASQAAQLGSTLTLDVTDKALQTKIAAIEARLATLTQGK